uniref:Glutamate--cysteine ligase n=1 Tax=Octopus bimaculoides TaxID=37653 RepID=A0A0L8FZY2_OCTBM
MMPYGEDLSEYGDNEEMKKHLKPGYIYMDSPIFGAGCCSLQVTFQAADMKEAAYLYDNLVPLTPLMPLTNGSVFIPTTRFDTVCSYLSVSDQFYNDYEYSYDPEQYELLKAEGI